MAWRATSWRRAALVVALGLLGTVPARAAEAPLAQVRLSAELLDEILAGLLPATVAGPRGMAEGEEQRLRLLGVRYCGPGEKGTGRFRAVARRDGGEAPRSAPACAGSLAESGERATPAFAEGTLLVELEASWKSWELKLAAVRALVMAKAGRSRSALGFERRFELATVSTADLRIDTGGQPIVLHAIPAFADKVVEIALVLADQAPRPPRIPSGRASLAEPANCAAEMPASFANQILRLLTAQQPLSIPLQGDQVDIANVSLSAKGEGEGAYLTLLGTAEPRSLRESTQWTLEATGEPLRVSSLTVAARYEDCAVLGTMAAMACRVRNGARAAAAEGFGRALTERYQSHFVHALASPVSFGFTVAGQRIGLHGDLLRMSASTSGLAATARLSSR